MQHESANTKLALRLIGLALPVFACTSSAPQMGYSQELSTAESSTRIEFFTRDPHLYDAALRSMQRIQSAIGTSGLVLADRGAAQRCEPFEAGCGFELSSAELVYCFGDPEPALACTSLGGGGKTIGVEMQADLAGDQLDNRLIHELFHVITLDRAPHSLDGLFMAYSVGDERITPGTLESVCGHFPCAQFIAEAESSSSAIVQR